MGVIRQRASSRSAAPRLFRHRKLYRKSDYVYCAYLAVDDVQHWRRRAERELLYPGRTNSGRFEAKRKDTGTSVGCIYPKYPWSLESHR